MNKIISITLTFCLLIILSSCGEKAGNTNQSPSATETATKAAKKERKDIDPVQGILDRFSKNKVALTAEQIQAIKDKGSKYDFTGETRYEKRVKYKDFRSEVTQEILSEEQRGLLSNRTGERKGKKKKQMEDEGEAN